MIAFIIRRLGVLFLILFGSSFILYNLTAITGDPIGDLRFSSDPEVQAQIEELERFLRLDVPPPLRYFIWLRGILGIFTGNPDFGATRLRTPVIDEISAAMPITIRLVIFATIFAIVVGIALGIVTALRQYSRFDYSMTFVAFLLFSLPIFWVAVLLKQYLAIQFNTFLADPSVTIPWKIGLGLVGGLFWGALFGRTRGGFWKAFVGVFIGTFIALTFIDEANWFLDPALGPVLIGILSVGIAFGITYLSTGLNNKAALYSSLTMAPLTVISYFVVSSSLNSSSSIPQLLRYALITIAVAVAVSFAFARIDRGPVIRTTILTGLLSAHLIIVDKFMQTWKPYMEDGAVNFRPIPTLGQAKELLPQNEFWISTLDILIHLFLPTIALTLISFAGYIRYSRGTLLEVLNQDYIRTARAKGLTERTVIMRHAFRNTLIPLTTIMVVDFAGIVGGAIITERVFGWYGMGTLFNRAITTQDLNLLMGVFFITASLAVIANLIADLLYSALDPRIRVGSGK
jgi:peptide/nickel transport system permease protein